MRKALFIDRDGTLNVDVNYAHKVEDCHLLEEGIGEVLQKCRDAGYLLIVTTNQAGIDKGYYTEEDFWKFHAELERQLGMQFDKVYFCPYHPDISGEHSWRKPNNGMILQANTDFDIDLSASYMIGDNLKDIEAGNKSQCKTILINKQNNLDVTDSHVVPEYVVMSWQEIEKIILHT